MDNLIAPKMAVIASLRKIFSTAAAAAAGSHSRQNPHPPSPSFKCPVFSKGHATVVTRSQMKTLMKGLTFALLLLGFLKFLLFTPSSHVLSSFVLPIFAWCFNTKGVNIKKKIKWQVPEAHIQ